MKLFLVLIAACSIALAQPPADPCAAEQQALALAFQEANGSPAEILRVIEKHLARCPNTAFRPKLEHDAAQAASMLHDDAQVIRYGEPSLARTPDDVKLLQWVTHSLLAGNSRDAAERALKYARRSEELARVYQKGSSPSNLNPFEWRNQTDRALARALTDDARATGSLGRTDEAIATAQKAFEAIPNADAAREIAFWYEKTGKPMEAVRALADAITVPDAQTSDADRARDRKHMGELYRKATGSEEHLGDVVLTAYDRNVALFQARERDLRKDQPNQGATDLVSLTLSGLDTKSLPLSSLKGKIVVMDLWATWCVPCREQHPLYEQVKERFKSDPSVVFLSVNTDIERQPVKSFVSALQWKGPIYFEDGLLQLLAVDSMPTTLILDRQGKLYTRMNGYAKEHFVDLLTERIRDALAARAN